MQAKIGMQKCTMLILDLRKGATIQNMAVQTFIDY